MNDPSKIHIHEGHDNAWAIAHQGRRNLRPFCGNWAARYKSPGKKGQWAKENIDWQPMWSLTIFHGTVKRMYERGSILTIKMFWPVNHDVQSRNARISFKSKQRDFTRETLDFKEPI